MKNQIVSGMSIPNILVVDDIPANLKILDDILKSEGYKIRPVPNGELALRAVAKEKPDLILLDIMMPGMYGFEVCRRLKEDPGLKDIPVIFISVLGETANIVKALSLGGVDYINKPIQAEEVKARVDTHIKLYRLSNELRNLNATLELKVEERTQELREVNQNLEKNIQDLHKAKEEIIRSRDQATKANLAKSEFLSRASHELRTPMNAILGFAQLLNMGELNQKHKKGVSYILTSGQHLLSLIDELLDISGIESGKLSILPESVELNSIVAEMMVTIQPFANASNIQLEPLIAPAGKIHVMFDKKWLKQLLLNLLSNAVKYNKQGGSISVKTENRPINEKGIVFIRISVTDTGSGISSDDIPKLFAPFERIGAEKTNTQGNGLGLAMVKRIMDATEGSVGVESIVGEGSTFWIEIPYVENEVIPDGEDIAETERGHESVNKTGKILYIEDNGSNVELMQQILANSRPNIELITSIYGMQALQLAIHCKPDLVLLDLKLPDLQGDLVLKQLQENERTFMIPVVIVTAEAMPHKYSQLIKLGAKYYITKPFEVMNLLNIIDEFINE
jgi:signal transduction histidine kinase